MYIEYNPNPAGKVVGDCVIRAISFVTNQTWDETYVWIFVFGFDLKDMMAANQVWETYLTYKGFVRTMLPDTCPSCYTVKQFTLDHPYGIYLLATGTHVVAVKDGNYYDAWDSGNEVPIYYWRKEQ